MNVFNQLTMRNLKLNKKRTIVTVIGILLSVSLVTAVATMFSSAKSSLIAFEKNEKGNYHYAFYGVDKGDMDVFQRNRKIEESYMVEDIGYAKLAGSQNEYKPYANIKAFTKEGLNHLGVQLKEGRLPRNEKEILVPSHVKSNGRVNIKVGDKLSLSVGQRKVNGERIQGNTSLEEGEKLVRTKEKQYTVVGMIQRLPREIESYSSAGYTFVTCKDEKNMGHVVDVYARYTKEGLENQSAVTASILRVKEDAFQKINEDLYLSEAEWKENMEKLGEPCYTYEKNAYLITLENGMFGNPQLNALCLAVFVVILIIIVTSVFCIKNSFDISISEKIRQYGMLSSVGATKRQIKRNVYFEAMILGGIGIPFGVLAGLFASWVLVYVSNYFVKGMLQFEMVLHISPFAILLSVFLGGVTIFFSARRSAVKASKVSPIQAIRGNEEVKIRAKKMKAPKWVQKIFGIGGEIAYKNLKRSRKKYRTTVISIIVSVSVFISLFSFVQMAFRFVETEFKRYDYNLDVSFDTAQISEEQIGKIKSLDGIKSYSYETTAIATMKNPSYSKDYVEAMEADGQEITGEGQVQISVMDEASFRQYAQKLHLDYEKVKDRGILYNTYFTYMYDEEAGTGKMYEIDKFAYKKGDMLQGTVVNDKGEKKEALEIEIAAVVKKPPMGSGTNELIVGPAFQKKLKAYGVRAEMYIDAEDAMRMQDDIEALFQEYSGNIYIDNMDENEKMMTSFYTLLSIFLYGFITVISLIGMTNIFNTITTNMSLRQREFAMLKSIGMTKKEFNHMIRLESFFYGMESLLLGIPIGVLLSYLLHNSMSGGEVALPFAFPTKAVLISVVAVFVLIACIMKYSVSKIQKQNIIETIREENI